MTNMNPPPFYMQNIKNIKNMQSQNGPYRSGEARSEIVAIWLICIIGKICKICKICGFWPPPRVRSAGLRCNAAVDMLERGAAVTLILFSSGNAQHAVPRNILLRRCWSYANNVSNNLPQPWHSVPMAHPSVLFIADVRDESIAIFYSQTIRARKKTYKSYSNTWIKHWFKDSIQESKPGRKSS